MSKRPRGLWKSQRSTASNSDPYITDIHIKTFGEGPTMFDSNKFSDFSNPINTADRMNPTKKRRISPVVERSTSPRSRPPSLSRHQSQSQPQWTRPDRLEKHDGLERSSDVENWEDIKELFAQAVDKYEAEAPEEAVELFRKVIHESDHLLRLYPDPMILLSNPSDHRLTNWLIQQQGATFPLRYPASDPGHSRDSRDIRDFKDSKHHRDSKDSRDPIRITDPPTTFHYVYGTSMLLLGKILEASPGLAKDVEPVNTPAFYLAALDVLEDGENACHSIKNHRFPKEDWRLAVSWGRTLVCLAEEKIRRLNQDQNRNEINVNGHGNHAQPPLVNFQDDLWPKDSAFGPAFSKRPPLTRKVSLPAMMPHEILLQATDQFSRAMLHMPRLKRTANDQKVNDSLTDDDSMEMTDTTDTDSSSASPKPSGHELDAPPSMPGLGLSFPSCSVNSANSSTHRTYSHGYGPGGPEGNRNNKIPQIGNADANSGSHWSRWRRSPGYIRPRMLFTISHDILNIADRMPNSHEKEYWAKWADDVFMQMEMGQISQRNHSSRINHGDRANNTSQSNNLHHNGNINGSDPTFGVEDWTYAISAGRARCWLIIGATRFEAIEGQLEQGSPLLSSQQAESARIALRRAVEYLERARASKTENSISLPEPDQSSPMLAEAFVTLAALTPEGHLKEYLFSRAAAEGVNVDEEDEAMAEA